MAHPRSPGRAPDPRLLDALAQERPLFVAHAPWAGVGAFATAVAAILLVCGAIGGVFMAGGPKALAIVWAVVFGGIAALVLAPRLRAGAGRRWFAATDSRLVALGRLGTVSIGWNDLAPDVRVWGRAERGTVALRLRGPGPAADAVLQAGLGHQRMGVAGRDPSVSQGGQRKFVRRGLEIHLAGVRRPYEVARVCEDRLGKPAADRAVASAWGQGGATRKVRRRLEAAGADVQVVARGASRWRQRGGNMALMGVFLLLSGLFVFLWASALADLHGARTGTLEPAGPATEAWAGALAFPLFFVPLLLATVVNLREAARPRPWVAAGRSGLQVLEGGSLRWIGWGRLAGPPAVLPGGLVRLHLARTDIDPAALALAPESIDLDGGRDADGLAGRIGRMATLGTERWPGPGVPG